MVCVLSSTQEFYHIDVMYIMAFVPIFFSFDYIMSIFSQGNIVLSTAAWFSFLWLYHE